MAGWYQTILASPVHLRTSLMLSFSTPKIVVPESLLWFLLVNKCNLTFVVGHSVLVLWYLECLIGLRSQVMLKIVLLYVYIVMFSCN